MPVFINQEAKDKSVATAEATVDRLTKTRDKAEATLAKASHQLRIAALDLEHRRSAPVDAEETNLLEGLEA